MTIIIERFDKIKSKILLLKSKKQVNIVAVSKSFPIEHIMPLIDYVTIILERIKYKRQCQNGV